MEKYAVPNKLPAKQISILAHRKRRITQKQASLLKKPTVKRIDVKSEEHFKKPEFFVAEFRKAERDDKRIKREIMKNGLNRDYMKDNTLILVLRHRGTHIASKQCINLLNQIGLRRLHQAVFLRLTPDTKAVLSLIEPYVIYGTPNPGTVRELIFKYGFIKYKDRKTSISSNTQIEELFGKCGVICVEDILHEVTTVGPNFDKILKAIYPFILPNPKDGWIGKKGLTFKKGGIAGYRGDKINDFINTLL